MPKVVRGTREAKKVGIIKTQHAAGINKMRCPGCKTGMAVKVMTIDGEVYRCNRCGRELKDEQRL